LFSSLSFPDPSSIHLYTLSLHDALPICPFTSSLFLIISPISLNAVCNSLLLVNSSTYCLGNCNKNVLSSKLNCSPVEKTLSLIRSEEHTSELQSRFELVCRLLLVKKKHY